MHFWLTIQAWIELLYVDLVGTRGFGAIQRAVTQTPMRSVPVRDATVREVVDAMKTACLLYGRRAQCLQRSAVITRLLRRRGVPACMIIGCHMAPLNAHAWVEVAGKTVGEESSDLAYYCVLDRW